jgi:glucose-6-phosphate isomerase
MHESVAKDGKTGQTFFGDEGPEVQHHTMQRVYGGKQNIVLLLTRVESKESVALSVPKVLRDIPVREGHLSVFDGLHAVSALDYELMGNMQHCKKENIPCILLTLKDRSLSSLSEYVVFWFYVAVYSALLRNVDPFNQPHVEYAKQNTFELLKKR